MSDNKLITKPILSDEFELWDEFVNKSPQGTVFHLSDWIKTSAAASNTKYEIVATFDNDNIVGGVPIYLHKKYFMPYATSNIELSPCGGFLLLPHISKNVRDNEKKDKAVLNSLRVYLERKKQISIAINNYINEVDLRPFIWNKWDSSIEYTYIIPLSNTNIWENISRKTRNIIRKGQKHNINVKVEYDPKCFWDLIVDTYKRQGKNVPVSSDYLKKLMDVAINDNLGEMWIAKMPNGDPASIEFLLWDNKMVHRWTAASSTAYNDTGVTSLLLFEILTEMQKRGFKKMNMMAANTQQLTKFVSGFNPDLVPCYSVSKSIIPMII